MLILGIDPSLSSTGFAYVDSDTKKILLKGKLNPSKKLTNDEKIQYIIVSLELLIPEEIDYIILEDGFIGKNKKGSLSLAELRGALIAYYKYNEYHVIHKQPKEIRSKFGLPGNAKKEEVANKVLSLYPELLKEIGPYSDGNNKHKTSDIYDAISIALSFIESNYE